MQVTGLITMVIDHLLLYEKKKNEKDYDLDFFKRSKSNQNYVLLNHVAIMYVQHR